MAWLAVDKDGSENVYYSEPGRFRDVFVTFGNGKFRNLPQGSIKKLIGKDLTWQDEPVEI